ncbi:EamA family transporter [Kitasatospora sp. NPDC054939]
MATAGSRLQLRYIAALAPMIWGTTYYATSEWLPPDRPLFAALLRALPTGLLLLIGRNTLPRGEWIWRSLVLGALNIGAFFALLFVAAYRLPGGLAAMVQSIQPLIVILLAAGLLGAAIRPIQVFAAVLGAVGVAVLVIKSAVHLDGIGVAAALASAVSMSAGIVLTKRWGRPAPLRIFTAWQLIGGGLVLLPLALAVEGVPTELTVTNGLGYAYLSLIGAALAYSLWFRGVEQFQPSALAFFALLSPVVAAIVGYLALDQGFTGWQFGGMVLVLAAIACGQFAGAPPAAKPAAPSAPEASPVPAGSAPGRA